MGLSAAPNTDRDRPRRTGVTPDLHAEDGAAGIYPLARRERACGCVVFLSFLAMLAAGVVVVCREDLAPPACRPTAGTAGVHRVRWCHAACARGPERPPQPPSTEDTPWTCDSPTVIAYSGQYMTRPKVTNAGTWQDPLD
ncbi:unnamed protein product [Boreogadus saida]